MEKRERELVRAIRLVERAMIICGELGLWSQSDELKHVAYRLRVKNGTEPKPDSFSARKK